MSDSCATTPPPPSSGDYANVIINCQCSLFNDSSSRLLNTPNHRYVTKIAIQVHRCVSKLLILRRSCITVPVTGSILWFSFPYTVTLREGDADADACTKVGWNGVNRRAMNILNLEECRSTTVGMFRTRWIEILTDINSERSLGLRGNGATTDY